MGFSFGDSGGGSDWGSGQGQGERGDGGGNGGGLIDAMHMVLILPDKWASGYIFDGLAAARAGLEAQRGSLPAGQSYKYEIYDREKVVESGTVSSNAYVPDTTHYRFIVTNSENLVIVKDSGEVYTSLASARAAAAAVIAAEKVKYPAKGTYDIAYYLAGQVVDRESPYWPSDRGDWRIEDGEGGDTGGDTDGDTGGDWPLKLFIIAGMVAVAIYFMFLRGKKLPAVPALPAAPTVASIPVPISEAKI